MPKRKAEATWNGDLKNGKGNLSFGNGAYEGAYSFKARFEEGTGTNPEELIGAAHAGCYAMALSADIAKAGFTPESVTANDEVFLEDGTITTIQLTVQANVPDIDEDTFQELAQSAKENCPVARALAGVNIKLNASLEN